MTAKTAKRRLIDVLGRENFPIADGCLHYFPDALAYVAYVSKVGNDQHNPGQPMHWSRGKSTDHENKIIKHLQGEDGLDTDEVLHAGKVAWRSLANLQEILERLHKLDLPRNARYDEPATKPAETKAYDEWIVWGGGDTPPVDHDLRVIVRFRDGSVNDEFSAGEWSWSHSSCRSSHSPSSDIVAYRVLQ